MESKLVEYARAVVEDAVDVDADFFQKFRDAMSFRAIMQSQHPYIIGVAISDILKKRVFSRRSTFLFIDKESRYAGDIEIGRDEKIYKKVYDSIPRSRMIEERLAKKGQRLILCLKNIIEEKQA